MYKRWCLYVLLLPGLYTGLTPMYLSEVSSLHIRGALGVLHQLGVVCGILLSQILGFPEILGTDDYWEILLGEGHVSVEDTSTNYLHTTYFYSFLCPFYGNRLVTNKHTKHESTYIYISIFALVRM